MIKLRSLADRADAFGFGQEVRDLEAEVERLEKDAVTCNTCACTEDSNGWYCCECVMNDPEERRLQAEIERLREELKIFRDYGSDPARLIPVLADQTVRLEAYSKSDRALRARLAEAVELGELARDDFIIKSTYAGWSWTVTGFIDSLIAKLRGEEPTDEP